MESELANTANSEKVGLRIPRLPNSFLEYDHIKVTTWGYPQISHKFRNYIRFAPVEIPERILDSGHRSRSRVQAERCPYCNALVAVGPSLSHHIFFCDRHNNTSFRGSDPAFVFRGVKP